MACAWLLWRLSRALAPSRVARTAVLYGIGSVAAYWSWLRVVAILADEGSIERPQYIEPPGTPTANTNRSDPMDEVFGLFPTPFLRAPARWRAAWWTAWCEHFSALAEHDNNASAQLSHTEMLQPGDSPLLVEAARLITPKIVDFGRCCSASGWAGRSRRCGSTCWTPAAARPCTTTPTASSRAWST